jgi:hypothetical protein
MFKKKEIYFIVAALLLALCFTKRQAAFVSVENLIMTVADGTHPPPPPPAPPAINLEQETWLSADGTHPPPPPPLFKLQDEGWLSADGTHPPPPPPLFIAASTFA